MNKMTYRNYAAMVEYDAVDRIFVGHLLGIHDIVGFHGSTVEELENAFRDAVDHYLEVCEKNWTEAAKILFRQIDLTYSTRNTFSRGLCGREPKKSINQWAADVLSQAAIHEG